MKRCVKLRLYIIKYGCNSLVHWDLDKDKLVASSTFHKWTWQLVSSCSVVWCGLLFLLLYTSFSVSATGRDMDNTVLEERFVLKYGKLSFLYLLYLVVTFIFFCFGQIIAKTSLGTGSELELCAFVNGCFRFDEKRNTIPFKNSGNVGQDVKRLELIALQICLLSIFFPVSLLFSIYSPLDTMKIVLETFLELEVNGPTAGLMWFSLLYSWLGFMLMNILILLSFPGIMAFTFCLVSVKSIKPTNLVRTTFGSRLSFRTGSLGVISVEDLATGYRKASICCKYFNGCMKYSMI